MITFLAEEIATATSVHLRSAKRRAKNQLWTYDEQPVRGGKRRHYHFDTLPEDVRQALAIAYPERLQVDSPAHAAQLAQKVAVKPKRAFTYDPDALWANFDRKNDKEKKRAQDKLAIIDDAVAMAETGLTMTDSLKAAAQKAGTSYHTVKNWWFGTPKKTGLIRYQHGDWLAALVNQYVGNTDNKWSDEAWAFFRGVYLRPEAPTVAACYQWTREAADEHGWSMPGKTACERAVKKYISREVRVLTRQGEAALARMFPAQQRTVRELHAMEWISGDGYLHNLFVKFPDGTVGRPKTWFWQDVRSRKLLGWRTDVSENSVMMRLAFGDVVDRYGIPEHITIDNTRAAANKWLTGGVPNRYRFKVVEDEPLGIFPAMGCRVHWTTVIHGEGRGQAKPIERAFGVGGLGELVDKRPEFAGAYTGPDPMHKPKNYGDRAVPLAEFQAVLDKAIRAFNAIGQRRTEICAGQLSFDDAFIESYNASRHLIRRPTDVQRRLWMMQAENVRVRVDSSIVLQIGRGPNGANRFSGDCLLARHGEKIVVRFDPDDLHAPVYCYTRDQVYIGMAEIMEAAGFGDAEAGQRWRREQTRKTKAAKELAEAEKGLSAAEAASYLSHDKTTVEMPGNDTVVRGAFDAPKRVVNGNAPIEEDAADRFNFDNFMARRHAAWKKDRI